MYITLVLYWSTITNESYLGSANSIFEYHEPYTHKTTHIYIYIYIVLQKYLTHASWGINVTHRYARFDPNFVSEKDRDLD